MDLAVLHLRHFFSGIHTLIPSVLRDCWGISLRGMIMAFNVRDKRAPRSAGPMQSSPSPSSTLGGGTQPGYAFEDKTALFLLATNSFFGQDKFYEKAKASDDRFVALVQKVTKADRVWMLDFITWLRASGNMRANAVVASVEASLIAPANPNKAASATGWARGLARAGIGRADEVGEALAYYASKYGRKNPPKPLKRGLADALVKHLNEYTAAKYNGSGKAWSLGQLIQWAHPAPGTVDQDDRFKYLVAKDYDANVEIPAGLSKLRLRAEVLKLDLQERRALMSNPQVGQILRDAGMTWEALAGWLQGPMDAKAWEAIIPSMGYMALLRNLRNFDEAKVGADSARYVAEKLAEPGLVARSKQFPFRFLAAYRAAPSLRWASALSAALDMSLRNIPALPGKTLVLVDTSGSMAHTFSEHSEMKRWDAAALFGIALGLAGNQVDVWSYADNWKQFHLTKGADTLGELKRWGEQGYNIGSGTNTFGALKATITPEHNRVIILTDEQHNWSAGVDYYGRHPSMDQIVGPSRHVFSFNLAGYAHGHAPTSKFHHSFGGLTDACFPLIAQIEQAHSGNWPWVKAD